ncbi:hypothetical protein A4R29_30090 (plasmid) [Mesorhizobium ciceri biovar biserrulae]|nr:hypothetical protein A4R29_30090 [Mesorhizobium ciceri biovar biserrulae]
MKTPVSVTVHSRREVNTALREGQYFFVDIRREGIVSTSSTGSRSLFQFLQAPWRPFGWEGTILRAACPKQERSLRVRSSSPARADKREPSFHSTEFYA